MHYIKQLIGKQLMEKRLIELLEDLTGSQNDDGQKQNDLLVRCLNVSRSDLEEFLDELSQLLGYFPNIYLPTLQAFTSHICNENSGTTQNINLQARWCTTLPSFTSQLITIVIIKNLHLSDIPSFGEILHNCVKLLWWTDRLTDNKDNKLKLAFQTMKHIFSTVLGRNGVLEVLISGPSGYHCFRRILFDFKMIDQIEREELLKAVNAVAALVEKCPEHKEALEGFSVCKACTALLGSLKKHQNMERKKRASISLSIQDEQYLTLLGLVIPQNSADLPNFLQLLERRKIDSLHDLMEFLPCASCHEQGLIYFSPDKYSSLMAEDESMNVGRPERIFDLPFEFDENDRLGPWDILLSENVITEMRMLESPLITINAVMKKLGQLSSGAWDKHGFRRIVLYHANPVYEVELPDYGLKILWQVDYGFSIRSYLLTQVIKVWAITTSQEQIRKTLGNLEIVRQVYTAKYISRCTVEEISRDNIILPKIFEEEEGTRSIESFECNPNMDDEMMLEVHKMLVTNKFIPLSKNLFKSLIMRGSKFTFQVSKVEYEIINHPTSAIIIGRSGTGKTTCILFRQVASYLTNRIPSNHKRQIFITVSYKLCRKVKLDFNQLQESATLAKRESMDQILEYLRKKDGEGSGIDRNNERMLEEDDEEQELSNIPNSFHELTDHHFPLFITYNKLSKMLLGTYGIDAQKLTKQQNLDTNSDANNDVKEEFYQSSFVKSINASWAHFVDYDLFHQKYWPHFSDHIRQKLDCELVYSEFSVIKGLNPDVNYLSKEDYRAISTKKYPVFRYNRDQIYDLFLRYEKMKAGNGHYDSMDRTLAILRCAKTEAFGGPLIHEVYIDECQDNHIVDFALILKIFDRTDSIFFAGDIAQCIARGSSFRFQDIRSLIYQWELSRIKANHDRRGSIKPKQFELNINYRSHNGILQLASSVIDLIWHFFPNSIDRLPRERGEIGGPQPTIIEEFRTETFNFFSGAEQVIIVRNDETKKRVKELKVAVVMTVFEAKGMEFDDVLLYDFFTDSPARSKWRVILSALDNHSKGIQTFVHEKHYILSSELKHLYVALTRARQHICIFDNNTEWSKPIQMYWKHHNLVKISQNTNDLSTLAKNSSPDEWNKQGRKFFECQKYEQAIFCFEKSGNKENYELANAYYLQQIARASVNNSDDDTIRINFISAAEAFKECSRPIQAVSCYQTINMYEEAGDVYAEWEKFEPAAHCFLKANIWYKAGKNFEKVKKYNDAARAYTDGSYYELAINLIERQEVDESTSHHIIEIIKSHYRANANSYGTFEEATDMFIRLINNEEDIIETLQFLLYICRIGILKKTMTNITCPSTLQEYLQKANEVITKAKSQLMMVSEQWKSLTEEMKLYEAYLNKDINIVYKCTQYFRYHKELANEFHAINIWLQLQSQLIESNIQAKDQHERLNYLLRLCELAFSFIDQCQNGKDFENIFCINETKNPQKRQIPFDSPLYHLLNKIRGNKIEDAEQNMNDQHIYDIKDVHHIISQFLASYIFELIQKSSQVGKNIPDIGSQICTKFIFCNDSNCRNHHVIPTPSILYQRLTLAYLQYTVVLKLDILCRHRLLKYEQNKEVFSAQRFWAERLIKIHIRYQTPQTSCPEVTQMVIAKLPEQVRNGLVNLAHKKWLQDEFNNASNFEVMLKCMFVFQHLKDKLGINKFNWEMSKTITISHPDNLPIGFKRYKEYNKVIKVIPVGKRLSSFFFYLYSNSVIYAISNIKVFIQYAIDNTKLVNMITFDAFSDLVSLMELTISLVFAIGPGYCDICLPRAYLINYFEAFTAEPLIPSQNVYNRKDYLAAIENSFDQVQQLLDLLIREEWVYFTIILRLIRLLALIGLNESEFAQKVFDLFGNLNDKAFSIKVKKYLETRYMEHLVKILHNDLKERGCDSLVIVQYHLGSLSKFSNLEKHGIMKLTYDSVEGFHSALQRIILSAITDQELATKLKAWFWFRQICDSPQAQKAVRKIQSWVRQAYGQEKPCDPILDKIYNDTIIFCQAIMREKGKKAVCKYNILLRGQTVDMVVELIKLRGKMDAIRNKLQKSINRPSNIKKIERYLELVDSLKYEHYENVSLALESLSITENLEKHKEADVSWLVNELQEAKNIIDWVLEWMEGCKAAM